MATLNATQHRNSTVMTSYVVEQHAHNIGHELAEAHASVLRFGDLVAIYTEEKITDRFSPGYLTADGINDLSVWLKEGYPDNFTDCLFRITARQSCSAQQILNKTLDKILDDRESFPNSSLNLKELAGRLNHLPAEEVQAVLSLAHEALAEQAQNEVDVKRSRGKQIGYGQSIHLQHVKTGKYLAEQEKKMADADNISSKVILQSSIGTEALFIMEPRFQTAGSLVFYGDSVIICCGKTEGASLHCAKETASGGGWDSGGFLHEVTALCERTFRMSWRIKLHTPWEEGADAFVKGGDVVRLLHQQSDSYVCFDDSDEPDESPPTAGGGGPAPVPVRLLPGRVAAEAAYSSLWQLEFPDATEGGRVRVGASCRLRHLATGRYAALPSSSSSYAWDGPAPVVTMDFVHPDTMLRIAANGELPAGGGGGGGGGGADLE
jgi:hypothetical protein